ncbi:MAG: O-antigen ligase family protein [bacterium]|nr:O-antigen ligase family protein [bacterium]
MRLVIRMLIYILLVVTPLILVRAIYYTAVNSKLFFSEFLLVIIIALWLNMVLWNKKVRFRISDLVGYINSPFSIPLLLFAGWIMFRNIFSPIPLLSWRESELFLLWIGLYFVCLDIFREKKTFYPIFWCLLGTGTVVALYGILQYFGYDPMPWSGRIAPKGKDIVISTFGNSNYVAEYLQPIAIVGLTWLFITATKSLSKAVAGIAVIILLTCIMISGAREAWVGLPLVALIGWMLLRNKSKGTPKLQSENQTPTRSKEEIQTPNTKLKNNITVSRIWIIILFIFLVVVVSGVILKASRHPEWLKLRIYSLSDVHQFQERFLIWQIGFNMIQTHPVWGLGAGGFRINFMEYLAQFMEKDENQIYVPTVNNWQGSNANQAHNDYLQFAVDFGLVGIALFFWFIATVIYFGVKSIRAEADSIRKLRITGLFLALIAIFIDAAVNFPFMLPGNGLFFWVLLALFSNSICIEMPNTMDKAPSSKQHVPNNISVLLIRILGSVIVVIFSIVLLSAIYRSVQASILLKIARKEVLLGQIQPALEKLEKSAKLDPFENETRFALGLVYQNLGQFDRAVYHYTQAFGYDYRKYVNLGETYFAIKNYPAAAIELEKAARIYPADPEPARLLGMLYSQYLPQPDKAIQYYEHYLRLVYQPEDALAIVEEIKRLKNSQTSERLERERLK